MSWSQSEQSCYQTHNSHLVEIYTQFQQDFLTMMALFLEEVTTEYSNWWIGLTDAGREGKWYWSNSLKPVNFTAWGAGQPNQGIDANYAGLYPAFDYKWDDMLETDLRYSICQFFM